MGHSGGWFLRVVGIAGVHVENIHNVFRTLSVLDLNHVAHLQSGFILLLFIKNA